MPFTISSLAARWRPPSDSLYPTLPIQAFFFLTASLQWLWAVRDAFFTGKSLSVADGALQDFMMSSQYHELDAAELVTMHTAAPGSIFLRKLGGGCLLGLASNKLFLFVFAVPFTDARSFFSMHQPTVLHALFSNLALAAFHLYTLAHVPPASPGPLFHALYFRIGLLALEAAVLAALYLREFLLPVGVRGALGRYRGEETDFQGYTYSKNGIVSRIVMRTVTLVSGFYSIIFFRDLFMPGVPIPSYPFDLAYLAFTRAFVHSPPPGSAGDARLGEAAFFVGDRLSSQLTALAMLLVVAYKMTSALLLRKGPMTSMAEVNSCIGLKRKDTERTSGYIKCTQTWKLAFFSDMLIWSTIWRFVHVAADKAGADFHMFHHLMVVFFETFILGCFGFLQPVIPNGKPEEPVPAIESDGEGAAKKAKKDA